MCWLIHRQKPSKLYFWPGTLNGRPSGMNQGPKSLPLSTSSLMASAIMGCIDLCSLPLDARWEREKTECSLPSMAVMVPPASVTKRVSGSHVPGLDAHLPVRISNACRHQASSSWVHSKKCLSDAAVRQGGLLHSIPCNLLFGAAEKRSAGHLFMPMLNDNSIRCPLNEWEAHNSFCWIWRSEKK